ncbi:hypothetical protein EIQ14_21390 [Xanthomonas campestris pv. campestris]
MRSGDAQGCKSAERLLTDAVTVQVLADLIKALNFCLFDVATATLCLDTLKARSDRSGSGVQPTYV